ncbi:ABC transporter permease [Billgrantia montanilacus]|uniref:ABC transporter permease n=2 Tax=Billgrantia montanilacus TaxID=2282305 RepID=A0A368TTW7_9GAMM|nr:ABC transporter permease [Halomonas montanilacus]
MAITLFVVVTVVFFATRLSGNAIDFIAGEGLDAQSRSELIAYYGLREDVFTQYWRYLRGMTEGEFGLSFTERRPVTQVFWERIGPTLQLIGGAILMTLVVAIPAGVFAAVRRRSTSAQSVMTLAFLGYATPNFVLATLMLLVFSYWLQILPSAGNSTWAHYLMPVTALSLTYIAALIRYTRNATLDVLGQDYLRTARAKGMSEREVIVRHVLRNTLITVLSVFGLMVTALVSSGAVVIESIFSWRGIGDLLVRAAIRRDYPVLQFGVLAVAAAVVVINTLIDIAYALVDPRVRLGARVS